MMEQSDMKAACSKGYEWFRMATLASVVLKAQ